MLRIINQKMLGSISRPNYRVILAAAAVLSGQASLAEAALLEDENPTTETAEFMDEGDTGRFIDQAARVKKAYDEHKENQVPEEDHEMAEQENNERAADKQVDPRLVRLLREQQATHEAGPGLNLDDTLDLEIENRDHVYVPPEKREIKRTNWASTERVTYWSFGREFEAKRDHIHMTVNDGRSYSYTIHPGHFRTVYMDRDGYTSTTRAAVDHEEQKLQEAQEAERQREIQQQQTRQKRAQTARLIAHARMAGGRGSR